MSQEPKRISIWSISEGWLTAYFLLYTIQFISGVSFLVWYETNFGMHEALPHTVANILKWSAAVPMIAASTSYIIAEGGRLTMILSNWVERQLEDRRRQRFATVREQALAEGIERGRKEGIEQGREEVREEAFEQGRAYERERIMNEANGSAPDDQTRENGI